MTRHLHSTKDNVNARLSTTLTGCASDDRSLLFAAAIPGRSAHPKEATQHAEASTQISREIDEGKLTLTETEHRMSSWDGVELFYRSWTPAAGATDRAIILFHRGHEHSGRWHDVIQKLNLPGFSFFAWDARGHGQSPGERGYAESFGCLVRDADCFVRHVSETYQIPYENIVVIAHSVGSVLASTWVHDYAPPIRALILGSPALRVRLYAPFAIPALRLWQKVKGKAFISSYVKGRLLTHDPEKRRSYDEDPLITPNIAVNILLGLYDAGTRLMADAGAIKLPVLILSSGADFVVKQSAQRAFFDALGATRKAMHRFPGFLHDTFNERDNHLPIGEARAFILDAFENPAETPDLRDADSAGYTKAEFDALYRPVPLFSPKGLHFAAARLFMRTIGRLSQGIRIGWETGFDSGSMLDYVYRNRAAGFTPLGRLIDRNYLDAPGWRGIRERKVNLEAMLHDTIGTLHTRGEDARIFDIATGHGRYVLDAIKTYPRDSVSALLRDFSDINVTAGRTLARNMGLDAVTFEQGDAFDRAALAAVPGNPNIGIVSGLYELFPENEQVRRSLSGLADAMHPGAYLIYTNQPWHPQLEFIARVLKSHRGGEDWVMRRRTQQEMDQLVAEAGFRKIRQLIDADGIFSVSLAQRV